MLSVLTWQQEEGFSLIEIMVGITILAVVLIPVLGYFANSTRLVHETEQRSIALNLAQERMEELKAMEFNAVIALDGTNEGYGSITNYPKFKRGIGVDSGPSGQNIRKITVTVYWNNDKSKIELETLMAKR